MVTVTVMVTGLGTEGITVTVTDDVTDDVGPASTGLIKLIPDLFLAYNDYHTYIICIYPCYHYCHHCHCHCHCHH